MSKITFLGLGQSAQQDGEELGCNLFCHQGVSWNMDWMLQEFQEHGDCLLTWCLSSLEHILVTTSLPKNVLTAGVMLPSAAILIQATGQAHAITSNIFLNDVSNVCSCIITATKCVNIIIILHCII